ncbi:unnamed protein product [Cylindrotheca closterium]|uniref:Uncharacterized protein n=1 Tax=Cylindrotheca closterium TaxID=2856 RepID=A0AAD2G7A0_9STRA|nr:unnamed protein product [Cylindrotheca closterium]
MMNRILLIAILALSPVSYVAGNQRKIVRLAKCFANDDDTDGTRFLAGHMGNGTGTLACLGNVSACFDDTTVETVKTCIQDGVAANNTGSRFLAGHTGGDGDEGNGEGFGMGGFRPQKGSGRGGALAGIVQGCLEEYKDCMKEEVRTFIREKLPACVNTTTVALGECYKTNADTCSDSCSQADIPDSNPFSGASSTGVRACQGFQNQIMNPSCDIIDCCPECETEFSDLLTCVGQELLELQPEPCELTCPSESTRRKLSTSSELRQYATRKLAGHVATEPDAAIVVDECAVYLDTEEEALTSDAVTDKILDGEFISCVADVAILVAEEQKEFAMDHNNGDQSASSSRNSVMSVTVFAAVFLGLVGLM